MKVSMCNRCGKVDGEADFEGMNVSIFTQEGLGSSKDSFLLCDPCVDKFRVWVAPMKPHRDDMGKGESR